MLIEYFIDSWVDMRVESHIAMLLKAFEGNGMVQQKQKSFKFCLLLLARKVAKCRSRRRVHDPLKLLTGENRLVLNEAVWRERPHWSALNCSTNLFLTTVEKWLGWLCLCKGSGHPLGMSQ